MVKKVGKYELGRTLGEGTFGKVKYAINTETNEAVAIKILDKESIQKQNMGNQIKKEISIMKMVCHKYVVSLIEVLASKAKIFIVLELVTGGELFDKIVSVKRLDEEQAKFYFRQLVEGVEYCHKLGVCHRDLKPENLLLDENGNLKISDFGLSSLYVGDADSDGASRTQLLHTTCGTPNYVAPEVLSDQGYDGKKADVWSIGVILYVLLAGFLPFDESTIANLFNKIKKAEFTYPSWFSNDVKSVIDSMLVADPKQRVSLTQLKENPWLKEETEVFTVDSDVFSSLNINDSNTTATNNSDIGFSVAAESPDDNLSDDDCDNDDEYGIKAEKPVTLNAFQLIAKSGGFQLDKMFSPEKFYIENTSQPNAAGILHFGSSSRSSYQKYSSLIRPPEDLLLEVLKIFIEYGFIFESNDLNTVAQRGFSRGNLRSSKGLITVTIQVFDVCSTLTLLSINRRKGDILEFQRLYSLILETKLSKLLCN